MAGALVSALLQHPLTLGGPSRVNLGPCRIYGKQHSPWELPLLTPTGTPKDLSVPYVRMAGYPGDPSMPDLAWLQHYLL